METKLVVVLALVATISAGPISNQEPQKCASTCSIPDNKKFNYESGTTYSYDYKVETETLMSGASEDKAMLTIECSAEIHVMSACEYSLTLKNTRLTNSDVNGRMQTTDNAAQFRNAVEQNELRFSFQDGVVENICPGTTEPAWVLNFKKGILSNFQNSMDVLTKAQNLTETDVAGSCNTEYQLVNDGYYTINIKKSKDILSCTGRNGFLTELQMMPYVVPADLQSVPILKSTHECGQEIKKSSYLTSSTCTETHVYRPFANGNSGGMTRVIQSLTYNTYRYENKVLDDVTAKDTLTFDFKTAEDYQMARSQVEQRLSEICDTTVTDIRPESAGHFAQLVIDMKSLSPSDMMNLYKLLKTKSMCPRNDKAYKMFIDALPYISTEASMRLMTNAIINEEIHRPLAYGWMTRLAFFKNPTSEMLSSAKALVDNKKTQTDAMLPVSAMINNYCLSQKYCAQDNNVLAIVASFERAIGYSCDARGDNFDKVLLALRAIGNAGLGTRSVAIISNCMNSADNPMEIRLSAAAAFRRMSCDVQDDKLWETYENNKLDSELRVAAFLAIMRCPTEETMRKMAASLETEDDNNVGAFVYSHLKNLKMTSDPHKQDVAQAAKNLHLNDKFDLSRLSHSHNFEASILINKLNMGFSAESNLIWPSAKKAPVSISGNLTVNLFGQSINLMDFGARAEGLEKLIDKNTDERTSKGKSDFYGSIYGRIFGNEMFFRHSDQENQLPIEGIPQNLMKLGIAMAKNQDISLSHSEQFMDLSMKVPTIAGLPITLQLNGSGTFNLLLNGKADLKKISVAPRSMEINGEIRPSASVEITGTMSVDAMVAKTGLRMRNTMHTSTSLKGSITLKRSKDFEMELEAPKDKMEIFNANSKFFLIHNNMEQEQDLIRENRRQYMTCSGDKMATIVGLELCGEVSYPNASMVMDAPYFPMTGPSSVSVALYNKDSHNKYKFMAVRSETDQKSIAKLSFNTPGSQVDRVLLMETELNYQKKTLDATLRTPWKKASFKGAVIDNEKMGSLSGSVQIDDSQEYAFTSEVKIDKSKFNTRLTPMVEIRRPGANNIQLTGAITFATPLRKADLDLSLSGVSQTPFTLKSAMENNMKNRGLTVAFSMDGKNVYTLESTNQFSIAGKKTVIANVKNSLSINTPYKNLMYLQSNVDYRENKALKLDSSLFVYRLLNKNATFKAALVKNEKKKGSKYDLDVSLKYSAMSAKLDSSTMVKNTLISTKNMISYTIPKVAKNKIQFNGKFNDKSNKVFKKYAIRSNFLVQKNPDYNVAMSVDVDHKKKHSAAEIEVKYGKNPKDKTKRLFFSTSLNRKLLTPKASILALKMKVEAPAHDVGVNMIGKHTHNRKMVDSNVVVTYGKGQQLKGELVLRDKSSKLMKYNGKVSVSGLGSTYTLTSMLDQKNPKQYSHVLNLLAGKGSKHTVNTIYTIGKLHKFETRLNSNLIKPISVSGSTNLSPHTYDPKNVILSGEVKRGKSAYGFNSVTKMSKFASNKIDLEFYYPERKVTVLVEGGKLKGNNYNGKIVTAWDAEKDKSKVLTLDGSVYMKKAKTAMSLGGDLSLTSPFKGFEDIAGNFKYGSDDNQHDLSSKLSLGGKGNMIVSTINMKRPISLENFVMDADLKTPFDGFKVMSVDVNHRFGAGSLRTSLNGKYEKETARLTIGGNNYGDLSNRNFNMSVDLMTSMKAAKNINLQLTHKDSNGKFMSKGDLKLNMQKYSYDLDMTHRQRGWQIQNNGDLTLVYPKKNFKSSWQHSSNERSIRSSLSGYLASKLGQQRFEFSADGTQDLINRGTINGNVKVDLPWGSLQNLELKLDHEHGSDMVDSQSNLKQNGEALGFHKIVFNSRRSELDAEVSFTPWGKSLDDVSGKMNARFSRYPMTVSGELSWSPKSKASLEGSLSMPTLTDASATLRLTTPVRNYKNIVMQASNKKEGEETVSLLSVDLGSRNEVNIESRINLGNNKNMRLQVITPIPYLRYLKTGIQAAGSLSNFDGTVDFENQPYIEKYQGKLNWKYDGNLNGQLRLDTPLADYPYFELSTSSVARGNMRTSSVEFEHQSRDQVYRLSNRFSLEPFVFEATLNSPHPQYNDIGLAVQHQQTDSSVMSHGEVTYQPNRKIEADLNLDWSGDVDGTFTVQTPFRNYRKNQVIVRHQGDMQEFTTHAEADITRQVVSFDARFKNDDRTEGSLTLNTPVEYMKDVRLSFNKQGDLNAFAGSATLSIDGKVSQASVNHQLSSSVLKSYLNINTPYTKNLKLNVNHNGNEESFTNKLSFNYGQQYDIDTTVSFDYNHPDINGNALIKAKLDAPVKTARMQFSKAGNLDDFRFSGTVSYDRNDVSLDGSWKLVDGVESHLTVNTPFENFNNLAFSLSHNGDLNNFKTESSVTYMDNKSITGKMAFELSGIERINFISELYTPFESLRSTQANLKHTYDDYNNELSGEAFLYTTIGRFGHSSVSYKKTGTLENFDAQINGKYGTDEVFASLQKTGSMENMKFNSRAGRNTDVIELSGSMNQRNGFKGDLKLKTPFKDMRMANLEYSHRGDLDDFTLATKALLNNEEIINGKIMNTIKTDSLKTDFSLKTLATPLLEFKLDTNFVNDNSLRTKVEGKYDQYTALVDGSLSQRGNVFDVQGTAMYNAGEFGSNKVVLRLNKAGEMNDFSFTGVCDLNDDKYILNGNFNSKANYKGSLTLRSPIRGYSNVGASFDVSGSSENFKTMFNVIVKDGESYSVKFDFYKYLMRRMETNLEVRTPISDYEYTKFEYRHEGDGDSLDCYGMVEYGKNQKISYEMKMAKSPTPTFSINLKTPFQNYEELMASGSLSYNLPEASAVTGKLNAGNGVVLSVNGNLDMSEDYSASLQISTPFQDFRNIGLNFKHEGDLNNFDTQGRVEFMDRKEISGQVNFKRGGSRINAFVRSPFDGFKLTRFTHTQNINSRSGQISSRSSFTYGDNKVFQANLNVESKPDYKLTATLNTPFSGYEVLSVSYLIDFTQPEYKVQGNVNMGQNKNIRLNSVLNLDDISGSINLLTPVEGYTNLNAEFKHSGDFKRFQSTGKLNYMDGKEISGKVTFSNNKWNSVAVSAELSTPFSGYESTKADLTFRKRSNLVISSFSFIYNNGKKIDGNMKMSNTPNYEFSCKINTPYKSLKWVRSNFKVDTKGPNYGIISFVNYFTNKKRNFKMTGKLNLFSANRMNGYLDVKTPIKGYEATRAEYKHKADSNSLNGEASLAYDNSRKLISAKVETALSPSFDAKIRVKTPFEGLKSFEGAAAYEKSFKRYEASSFVKVEDEEIYSVKSEIDHSIEPMRALVNVSTPFTNFKKTMLQLSHEGSNVKDFKSTAFFQNDVTDSINAEISMLWKEPKQFNLKTSLRSAMDGFEHLRYEMKSDVRSGNHRTSVLAGWTDEKKIKSSLEYRTLEGWNENSMAGDFTLTTPFEAVRSVNVMGEMKQKQNSGKEATLTVECNDRNLLDVSGEFNSADKQMVSLTFTQPKAMQFTASGSSQDLDLYANWDRNNRDSNVRMLGSRDNKDIRMSVERNEQTYGLSYSLDKSPKKLMSAGKFFWSAGPNSHISYDLTVADKSRRNQMISDAVLKLGFPYRALELSGSLTDGRVTKAGDITFKWDADKDADKKVTVKGNLAQGDRLTGDITLIMPAISKEIRVDGELMTDNGRIIFDSKTEFSYSTDSRKTVTVFSKIEDLSMSTSQNYSVAMGLSHPFTNIDLQMKTTMGQSDEKMNVGFEGSYLTSAQQTKNLALLAEINKMKKQISFEILEPTNFEVVGSVLSTEPAKLSLVSKMNDIDVFHSFFTFDMEKKFAEFTSEMNSETISMIAEYPSTTDFQAYLSHSNLEVNQKEALLAVHLNNSRLIHSRLTWNPKLLSMWSDSVNEKLTSVSIDVLNNWGVVNRRMAGEVSDKYAAVTQELSTELAPVIDAMEQEFNQITRLAMDLKVPDTLINVYRRMYYDLISSMRSNLNEMTSYPIDKKYYEFVGENVKSAILGGMNAMRSMAEFSKRMELALDQYKENTKKLASDLANTIYNGTGEYFKYAKVKLEEVKNFDVSPYIYSMEVPDQYNSLVDDVKEYAASGLRSVWNRPELEQFREHLNVIYQEGSWAYGYWEVEKNLQENVKNLLSVMVEIIEDELKEMAARRNELSNPITYYNPEQGELQAQFTVPFDVYSLQEKPDLTPLIARWEEYLETVKSYTVDSQAFKDMSQAISDAFDSEENTDNNEEMMDDFKPKRKYNPRKYNRNRRNRN